MITMYQYWFYILSCWIVYPMSKRRLFNYYESYVVCRKFMSFRSFCNIISRRQKMIKAAFKADAYEQVRRKLQWQYWLVFTNKMDLFFSHLPDLEGYLLPIFLFLEVVCLNHLLCNHSHRKWSEPVQLLD